MQVRVKTMLRLERRITVGNSSPDRIVIRVNKRLQQTASRVQVDGFRPGKVPMEVPSRKRLVAPPVGVMVR